MIGRGMLAVLAVLVAGCTKPAAPRPNAAKTDGGGWSIEGVEPSAEAGADAADPVRGEEDDGAEPHDPYATAGAARPEPADATGGEGPTRRDPTSTGARKRLVPIDHPQHGRLEGEGLANDCKRDGECFADGCAREVCSAQRGVTTTCEKTPVALPTDAACGCVEGECVWWSRSGTTLPLPERDASRPNSGESPRKGAQECDGRTCKPGQQCIEYYGIAGTSGPRFESCEWPCGKGQACPKGTSCVTVSDGPGRVCR